MSLEDRAGSFNKGPRVITLGTAGGPRWWVDNKSQSRQGISTAIVFEDSWYLIDCGSGLGRQIRASGLSLENLKGVFITHMHSDHVVDLASLILFAPYEKAADSSVPIPIMGPGNRPRVTQLSPHAISTPNPVCPKNPGAGIEAAFENLVAAYSADINDRIMDSLTPGPYEHFAPEDIEIPSGIDFDADDNVAPDMEPFVVFEDNRVTVRATLVSHHPTAPAFGFRFDTEAGSVTISGDTAPCQNLVRLAQGTDLLLHEAIDLASMAPKYADPLMREATMEHHRRAHTTPEDAGRIAAAAGAKRLALHHLVPVHAPTDAWSQATKTFGGPVLVPEDLEVISFERSARHDKATHLVG